MGNCLSSKPPPKLPSPDPDIKSNASVPVATPAENNYTPNPPVMLQLKIDRAINEGKKLVKAMYDYQVPADDAEASGDLNLKTNDILEILNEDNDWWFARNLMNNKQGYIPSTYVALYNSVQQFEWYHGDIDRKEAEKRLLAPGHINGTFLIRKSKPTDATATAAYALSVLEITDLPSPTTKASRASAATTTDKSVRHFRIRSLPDGRCLLSPKLVQPSLEKLIDMYLVGANGQNAAGTALPLLIRPCPKGKPVMFDVSHNTRDHWQIDRNVLTFENSVGKGQYGEVYKGKWLDRDVAIKSLTPGRMDSETFLAEATVMKKLRHENLVALYAVCLDAEPFYIVTEFMVNGDLRGYLHRMRNERIVDIKLRLRRLLDMAIQVAQGMAYIHTEGIIHRDLAARNVLVGDNDCVKISDFGLALQSTTQFDVTEINKMPIKWTSPEAVTKRQFSFKSDVWSFGILLIEIYSYGEMPYKGISTSELLQKLATGYRHPQPADCPLEIYDTMLYCWKQRPEERPTFEHIEDRLINIEEIDKQYQET